MKAELIEKVKTFTDEHALVEGVHSAVIGVSGGADSMCLLDLLHKSGAVALTVVHVHHGIRGDEADRDAEFVRAACLARELPLFIVRADVPAIAGAEKCGLEETGREVRYAVFRHIRQQVGADCIVTAHTASDQAETVLHNIIRGCGLSGLKGMSVRNGEFWRPLLSWSREDVERYCSENDIDYVVDSTNDDERYTRNVLRRTVLPLLRSINPSVDESLIRLSDAARADDDFMMRCAGEIVSENGIYRRVALLALPPAVRYRVLRQSLERIGCRSMEYRHFVMFEEMLVKGCGAVQLPGGFSLRVDGETVRVSAEATLTKSAVPDLLPLESLPFTAVFGDYLVNVSLETPESIDNFKKVHKMFFKYAIDYDRINGGLYCRGRRTGDYLHPAGRQVGKSVKTLMSEWRMNDRDCFPLLCDEKGIVMVPGYCCDERVRTSDGTKHFLVCTAEKITP